MVESLMHDYLIDFAGKKRRRGKKIFVLKITSNLRPEVRITTFNFGQFLIFSRNYVIVNIQMLLILSIGYFIRFAVKMLSFCIINSQTISKKPI